MAGSFEEFLGSSDAAVDAGRRRVLVLRDEMRRVASTTSASLRECSEALRKRDVQPDVGLVDYRYSVYPKGMRNRSLGVDTEVLAERAGWLLHGGKYALDTEGDLWLSYSVRAGVQGIAGRDGAMDKYRPLDSNARRWTPEGFARLDLAEEAERAELKLHDSGHVSSPTRALMPEVAVAEWPLYANVSSTVDICWSLQVRQMSAGLEARFPPGMTTKTSSPTSSRTCGTG